jgi:peroxiredoxin
MKAFDEAAARFGSLGATVAGISCDSVPVHKAWQQSIGCAKTLLLSDFNREFIRAYGVAIPELGGMKEIPKRSVFVIDRRGRIAYAWVGKHPGDIPEVGPVLEAVEKLK